MIPRQGIITFPRQTVPVVIMTHRASERSVQTAIREINHLPSLVAEPVTVIRVEDQEA